MKRRLKVYNISQKSDNQSNVQAKKLHLYNKKNLLTSFYHTERLLVSSMDEFDFDEIDEKPQKKPTNKLNEKQPSTKAIKSNSNKDDFFDFQTTQKPKPNQSAKKNNFQYNNIDSHLDEIQKKQFVKKVSEKNKENESTLPRIGVSKSPQHNDKKLVRSKMDLSLQELPEKRVMVEKQQKKVKKESEEFDFAVYDTQQKNINPNSQLKTNIVPVKEEKKPNQIKSALLNVSKTVEVVPNKNKSLEKPKVENKKVEENEDEYEEEYQEEIQQSEPKPSPPKKVPQQKPIVQKVESSKKDPVKQQQTQKQTKPQINSKPQTKQAPITRYKEMVQKNFPEDYDEEKAKKIKPEVLNRLNDKMRQMIKGFSAELTDLIDKNLLLLRKPENQIKEQIEGQPVDPVEAQIKILEQTRKNNEKMLEISEKQLQTTRKMNQKISQSVSTNVQVTEELQAFKKHIALITRQISNLKNQIQKEGKKVVNMEKSNQTAVDEPGGKFKNSLEISEKLANAKLDYEKYKKKHQELNEKERNLEQRINEVSYKRSQVLQKASNEGITFCSRQEKKKYEELKKKHEQLVLFESKFKSSIKSKQFVIQHEMTDLQVLIEDYEKRYEILNDEAYSSRQKIFAEIAKAKKNPRINSNTKDILTQLELFMSDDNSNHSDEQFSSLNYISQNIYKKEYNQKANIPKSLTEEKQQKKAAYKNYIQEVAKINEENKAKFTSQRRNSQINPFRKALTPGETSQAKQTQQKMNKTKDNKAQADRQKQRVWKSSNTQTLIRNPLKKQVNKNRYQNLTQEQNPLNNKQIMKLIDKNKEKIILKEEEKLQKAEESNPANKKPFTFRASLKDKQMLESLNATTDLPNKMEKIEKAIETRRNEIQIINNREKDHEDMNIGVKLKDKEPQVLQLTQDPKSVNSTPFRNIKLKKDKEKQTEPQKKIEQKIQQKHQSIQQSLPIPQIQEQLSFKPKRFNLRQKKQVSDNATYMPSSVQTEKQKQIQVEKPKEKQPEPQFKIQQNKFRISDPVKKQEEEQFDPFKKFMANPAKDQKAFSFAPETKNQGLKLNDQPPVINTKPRLNLFKKPAAGELQEGQKKENISKNPKKQESQIQEQRKFLNPYAKLQTQKQEGIKVQIQGRVKKMNPPVNTAKGTNKNIFGDVDDATSNNILSLGEPENKPVQQSYIPKSISQDKDLNVNDLLGIKKKNIEIDKDLIIDLPNNNKVGIKGKATGKASDFFGDMDL